MSEGRPTTTTELSPLRREQARRARRAEERRWRQRSGPVTTSFMVCPSCGSPHDRRESCPKSEGGGASVQMTVDDVLADIERNGL